MSETNDLTVAYLTNQYPLVSHTFIRREIQAVAAQGIRVERFSIRRSKNELVDEADRHEQRRTRAILDVGPLGLLAHSLAALLRNPAGWLATFVLAVRCSWNSDRGLGRHLIYFMEACVLRHWLLGTGAQHLHAHFATNSAMVAMLCSVLAKVPFSFTAHGPEEFDKPEALTLPEKLRRCAFVVAISEFARSQLFRWCDYDRWTDVHIVRCGVDESFLTGSSGSPADSRRLVCVGRLAPEKGQLRTVEACARLAAQGHDFELVLVGDGPFRPKIEALVDRLGLTDRVRITGWVDGGAVRDEIQASRGLVLASFAEGLPVVIMESLAMRRPVISTFVAGIPELVETGVNGWLVPAGSVSALAESIRLLLEAGAEELERMGHAGAERVAQRHNAAVEGRRLADLFRAGVGSRQAGRPPAP